ncbi:LPXTG cell wall anchor domain-containing protein [Robinsoniella sp. KNHs210]|uniref:LPXTG cell wall anchor domain-containing protein n=1 Tax=Robinsoniella sp. KNHs210 TaxID=1469950 RepID=UPI00048180A2|nr:LPXTG cell wall anchor domain-containing protein [Robinsoniella sp. KNHs210]
MKSSQQKKRRKMSILSMILAFVLAAVNILPMQTVEAAEGKTVYLNGQDGSNENSGQSSESAVSTLTKAKELMGENGGTIIVTGTLSVSWETTWSMPSGSVLKAASGLEGPVIAVTKDGSLTLNNFVIDGQKGNVISNSGYLALKDNVTLQVSGSRISADSAIYTAKEATTMKDGVLIAGVEKSEKETASSESGTDKIETEYIKDSEAVVPETAVTEAPGTDTAVTEAPGTDTAGSDTAGSDTTSTEAASDKTTTTETAATGAASTEPTTTETAVSGAASTETTTTESTTTETAATKPASTETAATEIISTDLTGTAATESASADSDITEQSESQAVTTTPSTEPFASEPSVSKPETTITETAKSAEQGSTGKKKTVKKAGNQKSKSQPETQTTAPTEDPIDNFATFNEMVYSLQVESREDISSAVEITKIYEALSEYEKSQVTEEAYNLMIQAQNTAGELNHAHNGVTVSGSLPWYVQFTAEINDSRDNGESGQIIVPYDLKLWDMYRNVAYVLEPGEKVTVTMPVPDADLSNGLTIYHYKADGTTEVLHPVINGETMSFETSSFSPFDVAGGTLLSGIGVNNSNNYTGGSTPSSTPSTNNNTNSTPNNTSNNSNGNNNGTSGSNTTNLKPQPAGSTLAASPNTGDATPIAVMVLGLLLSAGVIFLVLRGKRRMQ